VINAKDFSSLQKNRYSQGVGGNSRFFCRPVWPHTPYLSFLPCLAVSFIAAFVDGVSACMTSYTQHYFLYVEYILILIISSV